MNLYNMKTKNHIKSPKEDSLRGIGKLGWTEGGKMHSTIKRLTATFDQVRPPSKKRGFKIIVTCPNCSKTFNLNNAGRIPDHYPGRTYRYMYHNSNDLGICKGSWSKQKSDVKRTVKQVNIASAIGPLYIGDEFLIDFSRAILQEIEPRYTDIIESKLISIEKIETLTNGGEVYSWEEFLHFDNISKPINNRRSITQHFIKIN